MSELLGDATYRRFLDTKPQLPEVMADKGFMTSPPWVVYVQRDLEKPWGKKEFWKYTKALKFLKKQLELGAHDAALNCKRMGFSPPNRFARIRGKYVTGSDGIRRQATKAVPWKPRTELLMDQPEHHWCMYCRRPTLFKHYSRHKRLRSVDPTVRRCCICGASERIALEPRQRRI
jgi:hypothetical protein